MSLIQAELDRIGSTIRHSDPVPHYDELYAAQQALMWVLDPHTYKSPYALLVPISDTPADSEDYLEEIDHSQSLDNLGHRVSEPSPTPTFLAR